jgi:hypothetical protein
MDIQEAITTLASRRSYPIPTVDALIDAVPASQETIPLRLEALAGGWRSPSALESLRVILSVWEKAKYLPFRRGVIASGAMKAETMIQLLLAPFSHSDSVTRSARVEGWSLTSIGEPFAMPLFFFAVSWELAHYAHSIVVLILG